MKKKNSIDDNLIKKFGRGCKKILKKGGRAVIYIRVSSKDQEFGFSPETQKEVCYNWAMREGYEVVKCFEGEHESAKTDYKRKRFNQMVKFVKDKKNKIDAVIVYSTSRFSRGGAKTFSIVEELQERGIPFFSATSGYDSRTLNGKLAQQNEMIYAQYDNAFKGQCVRDNCARALRSGRWVHQVPLGYDMKTTKEEQIITVNEIGRLIKDAFEMKASENLSNEEVRVKMKASGLDLKKQRWSQIFKNIFYAGYFSNKFLDGDVVKGPHEALVSLEDFMKINGMLVKTHKSGYEVKTDKEYAPLLGTIKCPFCGGNLTSSLSTKMRKKYNREVGYYVCSRKGCKYNASTIRVNNKFEYFIDGVSLSDSLNEALKLQLKKAFPILNEKRMNEMKMLRTNLTKIEKDIDVIEGNFSLSKNEQDRDVCRRQLVKKEIERDEILKIISEADSSILNLKTYLDYGMKLKDNILKLWQIANLGDKKRIQDMMFLDGIVYNKENDDIEPISMNEFMLLFGLESKSYKDAKKEQVAKIDDLSAWVGHLGLEPRTSRL